MQALSSEARRPQNSGKVQSVLLRTTSRLAGSKAAAEEVNKGFFYMLFRHTRGLSFEIWM